ncbi:MAG TPA: C39 family peptidase [Planctomycetota bacterium]|nr:C39 family peptidase [Planctomycetota bacterium]
MDDLGDLRAVSFAASGKERVTTSATLVLEPFDECLVSWNARHSKSTGFGVEISVARAANAEFSPWMWIGEWNVSERPAELVPSFEDARIDVDTFTSKTPWRALRLRVRARANGSAPLDFALDRLTCMPTSRSARGAFGPPAAAVPRIAIPFRSQRAEDAALASRICSPTSLAMVLDAHGVHATTAEVARRAYDPFHDLYGNWNRAIQAAYSFGVPGRLERIANWRRAEELVRGGQPLILSIAAKAGELRGAPYAATQGHLLVLCGFDEKGDALVLDPAASDAQTGQATYAREDLETVWLKRGGTTYVLGHPRDEAR